MQYCSFTASDLTSITSDIHNWVLFLLWLHPFIQRRQWQPNPALLPGKSHGQKSLVGCSLWGRKESDTTELLNWTELNWRREWRTTSVFLPWEPHEQYERQNDRILKEELPRSVGAQYATGEQWRNYSRKNEGMEPNKNNTQLWMWLVIEARSDAVKSNIAQEPAKLGPGIKANWKWSNKRWQEWTSTF